MKKFLLAILFTLVLSGGASAECIKGNCVNGKGTWLFEDGDKYVGEHKNGEANGQGTYIFIDGDKYVGEWKDDNREGSGIFTLADGTSIKGIWKNDEFIKEE